jgi:hypothetical protein
MPKIWERWDEKIQENAAGILGTVAFHMVLIAVFLAIKISTEKSLLESLIMLEFEEELTEEELNLEEPDPEFEEKLAHFLEEPASNIPVNLARQIDRELSTEEYLRELEKDLDANRPEEYEEMQERLKELEEMEREGLAMEAEDIPEREPAVYEGPTNIYYDLEFRYHLRLPVPVYKCEGAGLIEVKIVVDQRGRVVKAETDKPGDTANEICLAEAAISAALKTRFNADYDAPPGQVGSITYHFIAQ